MADTDNNKAEASAEKAYAAASEAIGGKDAPETTETSDSAEPVEFPAKPTRGRKPHAAAADEPAASDEVSAEPTEAVTETPTETPIVEAPAVLEADPVAEAAPLPDPLPAAKPQTLVKRKTPVEAGAKLAVKRAPVKPEPAPAAPAKAAPARLRKPSVQKIKTATKTARPSVSAVPKRPLSEQRKEISMDMTSNVNEAVSSAQEKAKDVFSKTTAAVGEYGEFAKGNVEALVESGKILASGLQDLSSKFIADGRSAFDTLTAEVKELSGVKTPGDFFKLQTELLRRNLDSAIAYSSKTSEAMLKLTNEVIAPISGRVSLAVEKVRKAA